MHWSFYSTRDDVEERRLVTVQKTEVVNRRCNGHGTAICGGHDVEEPHTRTVYLAYSGNERRSSANVRQFDGRVFYDVTQPITVDEPHIQIIIRRRMAEALWRFVDWYRTRPIRRFRLQWKRFINNGCRSDRRYGVFTGLDRHR